MSEPPTLTINVTPILFERTFEYTRTFYGSNGNVWYEVIFEYGDNSERENRTGPDWVRGVDLLSSQDKLGQFARVFE